MLNKFWSIVFFILLLTNLTGIQGATPWMQYASKPLLLLVLSGWLIHATAGSANRLKLIVLSALLFSWAGDILLMFEKIKPEFFIAGLSAFLIAHLFYIIALNGIRKNWQLQLNWLYLIPVIGFYAVMMYVLYPRLGNLKIPVIIYALVISAMLFFALQLLQAKQKIVYIILLGAILFVASDSILAMNKFYARFHLAGFLVMLTYGFAQWFITNGMQQYFSTTRNSGEKLN